VTVFDKDDLLWQSGITPKIFSVEVCKHCYVNIVETMLFIAETVPLSWPPVKGQICSFPRMKCIKGETFCPQIFFNVSNPSFQIENFEKKKKNSTP
jgi:hypothetical protein